MSPIIYGPCWFLYISCLDHIKHDHSLIDALIEQWRRETNTFHFRYKEMTQTLQNVMILLGLPIDGRVVTFTGVRNRIVLCEWSFGLSLPPFELKGVVYVLSGLMRYFRHHQMILTMRSCGGTKSIMIWMCWLFINIVLIIIIIIIILICL
jgi:hypothetical protein